MKRLTNLQMQVLSKEVTNQLKKAHEEKYKSIVESEEYTNFEAFYNDSITYLLKDAINMATAHDLKIKQLEDIKTEALDKFEKAIEAVREETKDKDLKKILYSYNYHNTNNLQRVLENYLHEMRTRKYKETSFNEDEMLNTVQASILLSEIGDPKELVKELVDKFKNG